MDDKSTSIKTINSDHDLTDTGNINRSTRHTCGLNPWSSDMHPFHNHLSTLSENEIYRALLTKKFNRNIIERNSISYILKGENYYMVQKITKIRMKTNLNASFKSC